MGKKIIAPLNVPAELYTSCEELPLYNYIRCQVYKSYRKQLTISGNPTAEELTGAWEKIQSEYYNIAQDTLDLYALSLYFEIAQLEGRLEIISECLQVLEVYSVPECQDLFDILESFGLFAERDASKEDYIKKLDAVASRAKALIARHREKAARLTELQESGEKAEISVLYYDKILSNLSAHFKTFIDPRQITVSRYAAMLTQYLNYAEQVKSKQAVNEAG